MNWNHSVKVASTSAPQVHPVKRLVAEAGPLTPRVKEAVLLDAIEQWRAAVGRTAAETVEALEAPRSHELWALIAQACSNATGVNWSPPSDGLVDAVLTHLKYRALPRTDYWQAGR